MQICKMFIWEDLLNKYVEEMVFYCHSATIDALQVDLDTARQMLRQKDMQIHALEHELGNSFFDAPRAVESFWT